LRVGIVGLEAGRSWAARAHIPALRALADDYEIAGVANTSRASAEAAAAACGLPRAFSDVAELVASPDIDIVAVTVKVMQHVPVVAAAIAAGKPVYCEWPLGKDLTEARTLAELARKQGVKGVIGTQARAAPEIGYVADLIADGFVGEVLSSTLVACGRAWGDVTMAGGAYTLDRENGANLLTIAVGHALAAVGDVLGDIAELSATLATRRTLVTVAETGQRLPATSPDQVLVNGVFAAGAPFALHYMGGMPRGVGFSWRINGREGDIEVTAASGQAQMEQLTITAGRGADTELKPMPVPADRLSSGWPSETIPRNVAGVYARMAADLRQGTSTAPSFDDAIALHRLIAAIELA